MGQSVLCEAKPKALEVLEQGALQNLAVKPISRGRGWAAFAS